MPLTPRKVRSKLFAISRDIFFRTYPFQAHFFYETRGYNSFLGILKFLFTRNPVDGEYIRSYEKQFRELVDPEGYAFSFGTGRMALFAILEALGIGKGDEVLLPAFTCEVVVHSLLYRGIRPVYVDIKPDTFNIDIEEIEKKITKRTKAIIAQHTFGVPCEIEGIMDLAVRYNLFVIEDCAISLGSFYKGRHVGTFGHAAIFSTDRTKITSTQFGGMAFTKDQDISTKIEKVYLSSKFLKKGRVLNIAFQVLLSKILFSPYIYFWGKYLFLLGYRCKLFFDHVDDKVGFELPADYPCRLSNFQCFLGTGQLNNLKENLEIRKSLVERYAEIFNKKGINIQYPRERLPDVSLRFSFMLKDRKGFIRKWGKYFEAGTWFDSPVLGWYENLVRLGYWRGSCPVAETVNQHIINFPTHQASPKMREFLFKIIGSIKKDDLLMPAEIIKKENSR